MRIGLSLAGLVIASGVSGYLGETDVANWLLGTAVVGLSVIFIYGAWDAFFRRQR